MGINGDESECCSAVAVLLKSERRPPLTSAGKTAAARPGIAFIVFLACLLLWSNFAKGYVFVVLFFFSEAFYFTGLL